MLIIKTISVEKNLVISIYLLGTKAKIKLSKKKIDNKIIKNRNS